MANNDGDDDARDGRTHYEVLGIEQHATAPEIRKAYLRASLRHHPDKNPDDPEGARIRFVEVGRAHEVLRDPARRAEYDRALRRRAPFARRRAAAADGDDYRAHHDAFDAFVAGADEEELDGAAAAVGGVLGSLLGSRVLGRGGGVLGPLVGGMLGSAVGSDLARRLREESVERVTYEERRRRAVDRGAPAPPPPPPTWSERAERATAAASEAAALFADRAGGGGGSAVRSDGRTSWASLADTAVRMATMLQEQQRRQEEERQRQR